MRYASLLFLYLFWTLSPAAQPAHMPFPMHVKYYPGTIRPDNVTQKQLDDSVNAFYRHWKKRYIHGDNGPGKYYVWFESIGSNKRSVSEGQGYGMIIVAMMAGADPSAKTVYDGLFHYYRAHPSKYNKLLMAWSQKKDFKDTDHSSATDGDLDIAYSLLLADAQWGSSGQINYMLESKRMIDAIMKQEINQKCFSVLLSDAVEHDSKDYFDMRSSDFMPAHFKAFVHVSEDANWKKVIDSNYRLFSFMQHTYSSEAGLIPDFIVQINHTAKPAGPRYLESMYDGKYNYNACRVPWRIATDYILNGDKRAEAITGKINRWIRGTTQNNPDNISAGYTLAGEDLQTRHFEAMSFIAPFAVSAMIGRENQSWLNSLWTYILHFNIGQFDYYDNTIKMLDMLLISGNYWQPRLH